MYPDRDDVASVLNQLNLNSSKVKDIWTDVVCLRSFLDNAKGYTRNHGRHLFVSVHDTKKFAETFLGRAVSDDAMLVAMKLLNLKTKGTGPGALVYLPPLARFSERMTAWTEEQRDLEKEVTEEMSKIK